MEVLVVALQEQVARRDAHDLRAGFDERSIGFFLLIAEGVERSPEIVDLQRENDVCVGDGAAAIKGWRLGRLRPPPWTGACNVSASSAISSSLRRCAPSGRQGSAGCPRRRATSRPRLARPRHRPADWSSVSFGMRSFDRSAMGVPADRCLPRAPPAPSARSSRSCRRGSPIRRNGAARSACRPTLM